MTTALRLRAEMLLESDRAIRAADVAPTSVSEILPGTDLYDILTGGALQNAGVPVTEQTAMCVSAVYACVGLIGGALAALPFHIYRRTPEGRERYEEYIEFLADKFTK